MTHRGWAGQAACRHRGSAAGSSESGHGAEHDDAAASPALQDGGQGQSGGVQPSWLGAGSLGDTRGRAGRAVLAP